MTSLEGRRPRAVCIGAHIVDALGRPVTAIPEKQGRAILEEVRISVAGTAAGTAVDLAKLGVDVVSMGAIGDDVLGDFLVSAMRRSGVDAGLVVRKQGVQTSATILPIRANGERPALHCPGATAMLELGDIDMTAVHMADVVHLGGPDVCGPFGGEPARAVLAEARRHGAVTTVDVLSTGDGRTLTDLADLLAMTDYFLPNDDQLRRLTGVEDLVRAAELTVSLGVRAVLVGCGPDGGLLVTAEGHEWLPPAAASVVDSSGCGDGVTAGFIVGVLRGWPLLDAAWLGMATAAFVGSGLGSDAGDYDLAAVGHLVVSLAPPAVAQRVRDDLEGSPLGALVDRRTGRDLPDYAELPLAAGGGRSAWGLFGDDNDVGLFNLQTPSRVKAATRLVRTGEVFPLNAPIDVPTPPLFGRGRAAHSLLAAPERAGYDDKLDNFYPQASSQWDSLAHIAYSPGVFYNAATADDIDGGRRNTIEHWARRGIAGRAVLLDLDALFGGAGVGYDPSQTRGITVDELEAARRAAGVAYEDGDVVLLHTGYLRWHREQPRERRARLADSSTLCSVGIERSEEMAAYLWDRHIVAVASDNPAVEVWPPNRSEGPFGFLHRMLIGQFGMAIGELWWLDDLATSCRRDGRYEMFLTSAPLHVVGGIGSPANALAIK